MAGEHKPAIEVSKLAVDTYRAADAKWLLADNLSGLALLHAAVGEWLEAADEMKESTATFTEIDNKVGLSQDFDTLAAMAAWLGDADGPPGARRSGAGQRGGGRWRVPGATHLQDRTVSCAGARSPRRREV